MVLCFQPAVLAQVVFALHNVLLCPDELWSDVGTIAAASAGLDLLQVSSNYLYHTRRH